MTTTNNNNGQKTNETWGLDTNSLDDWLENDLKQSSLFQHHKPANNKSKCSLSHIITQDTSLQKDDNIEIKQEKIKAECLQEQQQQQIQADINDNATNIPIHLTRLVKIYSLLNSVRQNEKSTQNNIRHEIHNHSMMYTPPTPPSPIMSVDSSNNASIKTTKKRRGNNRPPVDELVKRQRNTDAARRSRLKKAVKMENLEKKVDELKTDNDRLRVRVAVLETEICHVTEKEKNNRQRVLELEAQLANAHKQLVKDYQKSE